MIKKTLLPYLSFSPRSFPHWRLSAVLPLFLLIWSSLGQAETIYITDEWRFEMRESPCWECRIAQSLSTGTELQIIETEEPVEGWTQVRTGGGNEGWITDRYLSSEPSAASQLKVALSTSKQAATEKQLLREQFDLISTELLDAGIHVEMVEVSSEDETVTIQSPRVIGDLATVGHQNEELLRRNQLLQNELDLRSAEIDRLSDTSWKTHFVYGASAVFAGVILCLMLTRIRPRKAYSEWA